MLIKRIKNKKVLYKVITSLLIGLTLIGGIIYQHNKINSLEYDLNIKQQVEERATDYTTTQMNKKTIEKKFNELQTYKIFSGTINFKHSYQYDQEYILGLHKKAKITATSDVFYECNIDLNNADIIEEDNKITILLDNPYINKETIHRVPNTFYMMEDESSSNILCDKEGCRKAQQYWEESLDEKAYDDIRDYYENHEMNTMKRNTKSKVKELVKTFVNDKRVYVDFK